MVLDECDPSLGISIVIRAASLHELNAVKRVLRLLIQMRYSNRCEQAFIELFNGSGPSLRSTCGVCALNQNADCDQPGQSSEFVNAMRKARLTNSPLIRLTPPYLETFKGKDCFLLQYFKKVCLWLLLGLIFSLIFSHRFISTDKKNCWMQTTAKLMPSNNSVLSKPNSTTLNQHFNKNMYTVCTVESSCLIWRRGCLNFELGPRYWLVV
jgi:hypothetical protein